MSICQIEEINKGGGAYPKSCPTCGLGGKCVKGLPHPFPAGEQPGKVSFVDPVDFASIRAGDYVRLGGEFEVLAAHEGENILLKLSGRFVTFYQAEPNGIVAHSRRSIKVGDRVMLQGVPQTIVALDHGTAWVRSDEGVGQLCSRYDLARADDVPAP